MNFKNAFSVFALIFFYLGLSGQESGNNADNPSLIIVNKDTIFNKFKNDLPSLHTETTHNSIFQRIGTNKPSTEQYNRNAIAQNNYRMALSFFINHKIDSAIFFAQKVIIEKKEDAPLLYEKATHELLSECYMLNADFKNAYWHKSEELNLIASINEKKGSSFLNKLEQLEAEKEELANLQKKQGYIIFFILLFSFVGVYYIVAKYKDKKLHKRLEEENRKHTKALERKNKKLRQSLKELERFNHIFSHDLKEPFRNIISFSELSLRDLSNNKTDNLSEYLGFISSSSQQMFNLIEKTRDFTNIDQPALFESSRINLNDLLKEIKTNLMIKPGNQHKVLLSHQLPVIYGNKERLGKILYLLIENGWKYNSSHFPTVVVAYQRREGHHVLTVRDNGNGIKKEFQEEVFKMYVRLDDRGKNNSAGMGLAICKKIAQKMGGDIVIAHSSPQEGTALEIRLPMKKAISKQAALSV